MDNLQQYDPCRVKEEHSEVFTLRSLDSCQEMLEFVPVYCRDSGGSEYNKTGHWSAKEHIKYVMFLDYFADIFSVKHNIKLWKIFTVMSIFIKTRNSSQCRSHHQKTQRKHHSIQEILRLQKAKYRNYQNQYQKMKQLLSKLPIHNPLEIQVKPEPMPYIPSLKVLQEDVNHMIVKKPVSLDNVNVLERSQKSEKSHNSCNRIIHYPREKYIPSQGSIDMDHQHDAHSQERIKLLLYEEIQFDYQKDKGNNWRFVESQGDVSQRKDQKFDRTEDTIFNDRKNKTNKTSSQQKAKYDSLPGRLSAKQEQDEILQEETSKIYTNLVRKQRTRTRSLLPYDAVENQGKVNPSRFCRESKRNKLHTPDGKSKTLPPRRFYDGNEEESSKVEKEDNNEPVVKSIFSGFISPFQSAGKDINENQMDYENKQESSHECNNKFEKERKNENEDDKMKEQEIQQNHSLFQPMYSQRKVPQQNLFFCDYGAKGNLFNEVSDIEEQQNEESFNFLQPKRFERAKSKEQNFMNLKQEEVKMNFTKKSAQQIRKIQHKEEFVQPSNFNQLQQHSPHHNDHHLHHNDFFPPPPIYHNSYIEPNHHQFHMPHYHQFYNPYLHSHQYPYMHHSYRQFLEFYIYFLIHKIQMVHAYYEPN